MSQKIEYRVRPVTRFIVTRFETVDGEVCSKSGGSTQHGTFDNFDTAYAVGYALCAAEHNRLGWNLGDERIRYPASVIFTEEERYERSSTNADL